MITIYSTRTEFIINNKIAFWVFEWAEQNNNYENEKMNEWKNESERYDVDIIIPVQPLGRLNCKTVHWFISHVWCFHVNQFVFFSLPIHSFHSVILVRIRYNLNNNRCMNNFNQQMNYKLHILFILSPCIIIIALAERYLSCLLFVVSTFMELMFSTWALIICGASAPWPPPSPTLIIVICN